MSWSSWPTTGVAPPTVVQGPVINSAPNVANPAAAMAGSSQYTPEQWAQMQQHNWQQWAQWQQQFQQWQQQYGAEYQKSMSAMQQSRGTTSQQTVPYYNMATPSQPPLPIETKPPPPPDDSHGSQVQQSQSTQHQIPQQQLQQQQLQHQQLQQQLHQQLQQQPPLPQAAANVSSVYTPTQYTQPPPMLPSGYTTAPPPPQSAPPQDHYQYNQNQPPSALPKTQGAFENRSMTEDNQKFNRNQNFPANKGNSNWQNQGGRNQGPKGDYGVKRPFNQQYNERGDMKRNRVENQPEGNKWQGGNQRTQRWNDPGVNQQNQRWGEQSQSEQFAQSMDETNNQRNQQWGESSNRADNRQQLKPIHSAVKPNPDEPSEAEKKFDKQFAEWEAQFQKWKSQNAHHPDTSQYQEYEKKWVTWRAQLLERREQMRRKRLGLAGNTPKTSVEKFQSLPKPEEAQSTLLEQQRSHVQTFPSMQQYSYDSSSAIPEIGSQVIPPIIEKKGFETSQAAASSGTDNNQSQVPIVEPCEAITLSNLSENENNQLLDKAQVVPLEHAVEETSQTVDDNSSGFLKTTSGDGIPGLDLVKEGEDSKELSATEEQKKKPDLEAISRGINSILGDQNLMNMLSLVSQAQPSQSTITNAQNTIAPVSNSPKFSPDEYGTNAENEEYSNQGNLDDQSRSSLNAINEPESFNRLNEGENASFDCRSFNMENPQAKENLDNFKPGFNNLNRNNDALNRGSDNFYNSSETVSRGPNSFKRDTDIFNRGPENLTRPFNDFNREADDFNSGTDNLNRGRNFNRGFDNFNRKPDNFNKNHDGVNRASTNFNRGSDTLNRDQDCFSRGSDSFNRGSDNFNTEQDNFNKIQDGFNRGSDNLNREQDSINKNQDGFNRGSDNFNRSSDNFNRGPDSFNQGSDNFNREQDNFNRGFDKFTGKSNNPSKGPPSLFDIDFSKGPTNFNRGPVNFGKGSDIQSADDRGWESDNSRRSSDDFNKDGLNIGSGNFRGGPGNFNKRGNLGRGCPPDNLNRGLLDNNRRGFDNFDRGGNNFTGDRPDFNRGGEDNFQRGGRGGNNFPRGGSDNFDRGNDNFSRGGSDNFNRGRGGLNRAAPDRFNRNSGSFLQESDNSYQEPQNFNRPATDFDRGPESLNNDIKIGIKGSEGFNAPGVKDLPSSGNVGRESSRLQLMQGNEGFEPTSRWSKPNIPPTPLIVAPPLEEKDEGIWKPHSVTDYEHKSLKSGEPDVLLVPINMFDYRHKFLSRIPFPQRPKWLSDTIKNVPEFDMSMGRQFDSQPLKRFSSKDPADSSRDRDRKGFDNWDRKAFDDRDRKSFEDRDRKFFDERDRKAFDDRDRKSFDERDRKSFDERDRKSFDERDRKSFDERDRKSFDDRDRKHFEERGRKHFDDRDRKSFDDRERKSFDDKDRKSFDERDKKSYDEKDRKDRKHDDRDRKYYDDRDRKRSDERDRKPYGSRDQKGHEEFKTSKTTDIEETQDVDSSRSNKDFEESENVFKNKGDSLEQKNVDFIKPDNKSGTGKTNVTLIEELLSSPGRFNRPPRIVIILRGPPGSGKSHLAKIIKDKEVENGGSAPRIICLDDYFMVEQDKEVYEDGKKVKVKEMVYEYEECMEASYRLSLMKSFKKTVTDGYFTFIIVDNINDKVKFFGEMWSFAKQNGFQVYICEMGLDVQACTKRNIHGRSEIEIERCVAGWESTPTHHPVLDASSLLQIDNITEVEMEEVSSPSSIEANVEPSLMAPANPYDTPKPWKTTSIWMSGQNQFKPNPDKKGFAGLTWKNTRNRRK